MDSDATPTRQECSGTSQVSKPRLKLNIIDGYVKEIAMKAKPKPMNKTDKCNNKSPNTVIAEASWFDMSGKQIISKIKVEADNNYSTKSKKKKKERPGDDRLLYIRELENVRTGKVYLDVSTKPFPPFENSATMPSKSSSSSHSVAAAPKRKVKVIENTKEKETVTDELANVFTSSINVFPGSSSGDVVSPGNNNNHNNCTAHCFPNTSFAFADNINDGGYFSESNKDVHLSSPDSPDSTENLINELFNESCNGSQSTSNALNNCQDLIADLNAVADLPSVVPMKADPPLTEHELQLLFEELNETYHSL